MGIIDDFIQGLPENSILRKTVSELRTENTLLKDEIAALKDDIRQFEAENKRLKEQIQSLTHTEDLHKTEIKILSLIARSSNYGMAEVLAEPLGLPLERVEYHLQELITQNYLNRHVSFSQPDTYSITQKGRKYLIDHDLL